MEEPFPHVAASLAPHTVKAGLVAELELNPDKVGVWPARVVAVCGPLLQVRPLGEKRVQWYDINLGVWPWRSGRQLSPPSDLCLEAGGEGASQDWHARFQDEVGESGLAQALPPGHGNCPADTWRPGMKAELLSDENPREGWGVTVTENTGGLLGISLDSPELKASSTHLRLFCTSPRLLSCGSIAPSSTLSFKAPACLRAKNYPDKVWKAVMQSFGEVALERQAPTQCLPEQTTKAKHGFQERMLLTVIDPESKDQLRVVIVDKLIDVTTFVISLLERPDTKVVCSAESEFIVPISWAIEHHFLEKASLQTMSCSPLSKIAPRNLFRALTRPPAPFSLGEELEFCRNADNLEFCPAKVEEVKGRLLQLSLTTKDGKKNILSTATSLDIFPKGWAESNGIQLQIAAENLATEESGINGIRLPIALPVPVRSPLPVAENSWCPPIYFNHLCYSASFLSRHRLESLPRYIGGGPVRLVMREVLSRLIGSSFKSGAVLRKLEVSGRPRPGFWVETMKGKSRVLMLQADVEIPSMGSQVVPFCREVCQKLSCCPYLFGPQLVGEECPSACNSRPKSDFHIATTESGDQRNRRGTKRGRRKGKVGADVGGGQQTPSGTGGAPSPSSSPGSSPSASPTPSTAVTTCTTRESSPCAGRQLAGQPSDTEVEALQRILAEKCQDEMEEDEEETREESPPPQPPSPKLLRSKSSLTAQLPKPDGRSGACAPSQIGNKKRGSPGLGPAFQIDLDAPCPQFVDPPPVKGVILESNPLLWTPTQVAEYLSQQEDVARHAPLFLKDEVDGPALLLLNLPSMLDHWQLMTLGEGISLAKQVESIKLAFYSQFAFKQEARSKKGT